MSQETLYDSLEYTPSGVYLLDGVPFVGNAYDYTSDGKRVSSIPFAAGREHGLAFGFYPEGQKQQETPYRMGKRHGIEREWHPDGMPKEENVFEFGVLMSSIEWSNSGELTKEYVRPSNDHLYQLVLKARLLAEQTKDVS